jgi:hypothetical protein
MRDGSPSSKSMLRIRWLGIMIVAVAVTTPYMSTVLGMNARDWQVYADGYGTQVEYPSDIFSRSGGQSERGIGERFLTSDGQSVLDVYSIRNGPSVSPEEFLRANLKTPRSELEYERVTNSFFAISNVNDGVIYYSRCNFSRTPQPLISCIDMKYPQNQKRAWDGIVTRISRSLRPLLR